MSVDMSVDMLFLELKKNIVRFRHENVRIFKEFRSIVNMLRTLILSTHVSQYYKTIFQ